MTKSISAFEAPALVDAHSNVTKLELYERLRGKTLPAGAAGLTSFMAEGAMAFAAQDAGWSKIVRHDRNADIGGVEGYARAWTTSDEQGEFVAVFQHVPSYMHSISWAKAGVPPRSAALSAIWTAMVFKAKRVAVVVLADKRLVTYWVEPTSDEVAELTAGAADMARRLAEGDAPSVDSGDKAEPKAIIGEVTAEQDLDVLVGRWKATGEVAAEANNAVRFADQAFEAATTVLKAALPKGASHEVGGIKVSHNAKTGKIKEEKTDAAYF